MEADDQDTRTETMAEMIRARMLVEIDWDALLTHNDSSLYVSDEYQLGYGETETAAKRPKTRTDVLTACCGLATDVESGRRIVCTLPKVSRRNIGCNASKGSVLK